MWQGHLRREPHSFQGVRLCSYDHTRAAGVYMYARAWVRMLVDAWMLEVPPPPTSLMAGTFAHATTPVHVSPSYIPYASSCC